MYSFVFCTLDGVRWDKFVEQFNIKQEELPRLFVLDAQVRSVASGSSWLCSARACNC